MSADECGATSDQARVLDSSARVRVVRAVPGGGKTWLVGQIIKRELADGESRSAGVAALSFTRVAGEEIRCAVGRTLSHPHFVGTLDSFVYRFVVRPFLRKFRPNYALPRLLPAEWNPQAWAQERGSLAHVDHPSADTRIPLLHVDFVGISEACPVLRYRNNWGGREEFTGQVARRILRAKKELWRQRGWMSHSDVAFIGAGVLEDAAGGAHVRRELLRRFRLLVIDEAQDTGWFLGQCVMALLSGADGRGVVVGDPDQAIFEFNGARPELFDRFSELDGSVPFTLSTSRRCSRAVARAAQPLARDHDVIVPREDALAGGAFLLSYRDLLPDISGLREHLAVRFPNGRTVRIVTRLNKTLELLRGAQGRQAPKLGSRPLAHLHRGVNCLRRGRNGAALAEARAAIGQWLLKRPDLDDEALKALEVTASQFRSVAVGCLLEASRELGEESLGDWGERVRGFMYSAVEPIRERLLAAAQQPRLSQVRRSERGAVRRTYLASMGVAARDGIELQTVHAVKGETHDVTVLVCAEASGRVQCPSVAWWSEEDELQEERRIAFVAATRPRDTLIICVTERSLEALQQDQPEFVSHFQCSSISEYVSAPRGPDAPGRQSALQ